MKSDLSLFNLSPRKLAAKLISSKQGIRRLFSAFLPAQEKKTIDTKSLGVPKKTDWPG